MLYSNELEQILRSVDGFKGVFALNNIPSDENRPSSFIINSDKDNQPGEHWMAIILPPGPNTFGIFIDPYGLPLHLLFNKINYYLSVTCTHIKELPYPIQSLTSEACGYFCAYIIYHLPSYYYNILQLTESCFSKTDMIYNEHVVKKWYKSRMQVARNS